MDIIREQINKIKNFITESEIKDKHRLILNHIRLYEIFKPLSLNEDEIDIEKVKDVLTKLKKNDFEPHNPIAFKNAITGNKHPLMLTDYSISELDKMKLFKLNGYDIGYALKKNDTDDYNEIVSVFSNEPGVKGVGDDLIKSAVNNGGCYLDHFDCYLSNLYSRNGFIEIKREKYNSMYDQDGMFKKKYGESDVIYRVHKNCIKKV